MKRWEIALAIAGAILVALAAYAMRRAELPRCDIVLQEGGCRTPITIFDPPQNIAPAGAVIVLRGLSANRRIMMYLGADFAGHGIRAYLPDLPGHGDNTDAFSFARAEECARVAVSALMRRDSLDPAKMILLGHSMGGEIAVRMADKIPVGATVVISPAPMVLPQRMPANLLVFSAQFDVWQLKAQAATLQQAAGGDRIAPDDFAERRAFNLVRVPLATHTSMIDDPRVAHDSELWAMQSLFPAADSKTLALNLDLGTYETFGRGRRRLAEGILGLLGIGMMMPLCITIVAKIAGAPHESAAQTAPARGVVLAECGIAVLAAVLLLVPGVPLRFVHLYAGDYLASTVAIVGAALLVLNRAAARQILSVRPLQLLAAAVLGMVTILAIGAWFDWQISDLWLNAPRWVRFAELLPFACIFCFAEEVVLGPLGSGRSRAIRFAVFLGLRFEIWLACVVAFFMLASGQILLPILALQLGALSAGQRLAADALLRRTGSAMAAAFFGAILASWFVAAVFPIT
jgi:pimeloyl-ACP methyl ester carboxylesterase